MAYSKRGKYMPLKPEIPVFPQPLIMAKFPPCECICTWAYSPRIYGTIDKPYVLKIRYSICPVRSHRAHPTREEEWRENNV